MFIPYALPPHINSRPKIEDVMHFHWLLQVEHVSTKAALHTTVHQGQTENEDTTPGGMYTIYQ